MNVDRGEKKLNRFRNSLAINVIGTIILLLILFGLISSAIGFVSFTNAIRKEYSESTYHMAETAAMMVNGDHLRAYLEGEEQEEFLQTKEYLDRYCDKMHVSLVYVILVDQSDYGRFVTVFDAVDNEVGGTAYSPWEIGHEQDTTDDEYRRSYKALYDQTSPYETIIYHIQTTDGKYFYITTMVPVKDSMQNVAGILCIQRPIQEIQNARRPYLVTIAISTILLAVLASAFSAVYLQRQFVIPVRRVSEEAVRFARENTLGQPMQNISRMEEIHNLAVSIDTMEADTMNYIRNLAEITAEKQRVNTELSMANEIQAGMLPNVFPPFPERAEFDIFASMDPAREVGGDFYNFFLIDSDHLCVLVADVSGKGIPAALFMMASFIILTNNAMMGLSPGQILTETNTAICDSNKEEMFVTVWLGILELSTGKLTAANAGHEYPALMQKDGSFELYKDKHGFVIGGLEGMKYREYELTLTPGSKLFLYTDGVPEAANGKNEMFGTNRMIHTLNEEPGATPEQLLRRVRQAVDAFVHGAEQVDDLTMLCLEYRGGNADA